MSSSEETGAKKPESQRAKREETELYGYHFYPERDGRKELSFLKKIADGGKTPKYNAKCIANVYTCMAHNPLVRVLMGAMASLGCPITPSRHISCEDCHARVNGGFDPTTNQVVICQNNSRRQKLVCSSIVHEFIHMFDYCRAKVDFTNLDHLACTEIRAANIMHCSFLSAWVDGDASFLKFRDAQKSCVRRKALMAVLTVRNITDKEGMDAIDRVFDRCYNDLEPFGRIPRRKSRDPQRILKEAFLYGYSDQMG